MLSQEKLYLKNLNYSEEKIGDKTLLVPKNFFDSDDILYFENKTAEDIWRYLIKPKKLSEIVDYIKKCFDIYEVKEIKNDILLFMDSLLERQAIKEIDDIKIIPVSQSSSENLSEILSKDIKLNHSLNGSDPKNIMPNEFYENIVKWQDKTNSIVYSIVFDNKDIGTISLSHMELNKKTARIGYWLASEYWSFGLCSRAFSKVLEIAKAKSFKTVLCSIPLDNSNSFKIWKHYNIEYEIIDNNYKVSLNL
ncbi:MAG: GNAT family N-acetyltransferase [Clostridiales bacterium]